MVGASFKQMANIFSFNLLIGVFPAHVRYAFVFENARNHSQELVTVVSDYHNIQKGDFLGTHYLLVLEQIIVMHDMKNHMLD